MVIDFRLYVGSCLGLAAASCSVDTGGNNIPSLDSAGSSSSAGTTNSGGSTTATSMVDGSTGEPELSGPRKRRIELAMSPALNGDFTTLVVLNSERIEYEVMQPDGSDLRFFAPDESRVYAMQIEQWQPGGTSYIWVRMTEAGPLPDHLWMYYGDGESYPSSDSGQVWDEDYAAVWHMGRFQVDNNVFVADSSPNKHDLEPIGFSGDLQVAGIVGPAAAFTPMGMPVDDGPLQVDDVGLSEGTDAVTLEAWIAPNTIGDAMTPRYAIRKLDAFELRATGRPSGGGGADTTFPGLVLRLASLPGVFVTGPNSTLAESEWTYVAATYHADIGTMQFFRNGMHETNRQIEGTPEERAISASEAPVQIGRDFDGMLDEVRISTVARSEDYLRLQHASMRDELLSFGPPQPQ